MAKINILESLPRVVVAMSAIALISTSAFAGGGKNERVREMREQKRLQRTDTQSAGSSYSPSTRRDGRYYVDKGDAGVYVRDGRFLKPVNSAQKSGFRTRGGQRPGGGTEIVHEHGADGKSHRNVKKDKEE